MILIEAGQTDERGFEAKLQFAGQLAAHGYRVFIDAENLPENLAAVPKYEAIGLLAELDDVQLSGVIVIGAENISDGLLTRLRGYKLGAECQVSAVGRFSGHQAVISAQSKLAYTLGYEPQVVDLSQMQPRPIYPSAMAPVFASNWEQEAREGEAVHLTLIIPKDFLEDAAALPTLELIGNIPGLKTSVVTASVGKEFLRAVPYPNVAVLGFSEFSPVTLARRSDIVAVYGKKISGERMAAFCLEAIRKQGVVLDCTETGAIVAAGAPAVRGPIGIASLPSFIQDSILVNRKAIGQEAAMHPWMRENRLERLLAVLGLEKPPALATGAGGRPGKTVFLPTNGVGLGHAQRCSLIAAEMGQESKPGFAAFSSCIPMLQDKGFDCLPLVQKSEEHEDIFANDLVNYLRLGRLTNFGDRFVFDGGYVFDSIFRTILEKNLRAVWIRRGLWQAGQSLRTPMERETVFERVIVPAEAFDELNVDYSFGAHVHRVGPIVQQRGLNPAERKKLRARLADRFQPGFRKLVVSMLGGGEAADRSAQLQAISAMVESRPDWLHLIVVWPSAKVSAALHGWNNTHVVTSMRAIDLCLAADLLVSAAGYNSYHEVLYHQIPTIFVPQMAAYMDDQERRARAASERELAVTVLAEELMTLQREITACLEGGKAEVLRRNLAAVELPARGTRAAAKLIEEVGRG